ncbi:hypothetical protein PM082_011021 [Marasmius tenuissimus]|nr:hypothetical protein PM082_011021 [Marasmius tenuissimus]
MSNHHHTNALQTSIRFAEHPSLKPFSRKLALHPMDAKNDMLLEHIKELEHENQSLICEVPILVPS